MQWLGLDIWFWIIIGAIIPFIIIGIFIWRKRAWLRERYYLFRFPEKCLKVVIYYKSNIFKSFIRLIPDEKHFSVEGKTYNYSDKMILKDNEFFVHEDKGRTVVTVEGISYDLVEKGIIKRQKDVLPEIHYFYNNPNPIIYDYNQGVLDLSASEMEEFKENDLFLKLLTLGQQNAMMFLIIVLCIINLLATLYIIAKMQGWIK